MPQAHSRVIVHIVFSTKNRDPYILPEIRPRLHAYLATVGRNMDATAFNVGGTADHVHIAMTLPRLLNQSDLIAGLKTPSSHWMKEQDPRLANFYWQRGYGIFSLGQSGLDELLQYIDGQEEHHRKRTFQDEYRELLRRYEMESDERYMWD